jgi:uncharacterized membrane protein
VSVAQPDLPIEAAGMMTHYNRWAGRSIERLAALSDGVFAVAMTLLVLDLHAPAAEAMHGEADLWAALLALAPRMLVYLLSFLTLGIFWVGQQTQLNFLAHGDRHLTWLHLTFLFAVAVMPFSTALMAEFVAYRTALLVYWVNLALFGALLFATWRYAEGARLVKPDAPADLGAGLKRRVVVAQALYAFGALLCVFDTRWSIGFIVLLQLNYAIAPRLPLLSRL